LLFVFASPAPSPAFPASLSPTPSLAWATPLPLPGPVLAPPRGAGLGCERAACAPGRRKSTDPLSPARPNAGVYVGCLAARGLRPLAPPPPPVPPPRCPLLSRVVGVVKLLTALSLGDPALPAPAAPALATAPPPAPPSLPTRGRTSPGSAPLVKQPEVQGHTCACSHTHQRPHALDTRAHEHTCTGVAGEIAVEGARVVALCHPQAVRRCSAGALGTHARTHASKQTHDLTRALWREAPPGTSIIAAQSACSIAQPIALLRMPLTAHRAGSVEKRGRRASGLDCVNETL